MTTVHPMGRTPHRIGKRRYPWRLVVVAALAIVAWWLATAVNPVVVVAVATVSAIVAARRRLRWRQLNRRTVVPTVAALSTAVGADLRFRLNRPMRQMVPAPARQLSPVEEGVRRWYGRRVEPVVRAPANVGHRVSSATLRKLDPVTRPHLRQPRITLEVAKPYLTSEERKYVSSVVHSKVPIRGLVESWDLVGDRVRATWTVRSRPPRRVDAGDLVAMLPTLDDDSFFLGRGGGGQPVVISLHDDSPHVAVSAGSGAGKSVLASVLAVQVLARGGVVAIVDRKGSHRWARGLDGVVYATRSAEQHELLVSLAQLADERNAEAFAGGDEIPESGKTCPRVLVVVEELNATIGQLRHHWDAIRQPGQPRPSPAVRSLAELLYMGRSARVNVVGVAQMLTARAIGGPEARENFAIRCLARYSVNGWKMLAPEAPMPPAGRTLGRWQVVTGGTATETQVVNLTAADARRIAAVPGVRDVPDGLDRDREQERPHGQPVVVDITLRQAIDHGLLPWTLEATQKRLQRARADGRYVPAPTGKQHRADTYTVGELAAWVQSESRGVK